MKKAQLPTRQPEQLIKKVKSDASLFGLTKDGVVQAALTNLFALNDKQRFVVYATVPRKIFGRPIK